MKHYFIYPKKRKKINIMEGKSSKKRIVFFNQNANISISWSKDRNHNLAQCIYRQFQSLLIFFPIIYARRRWKEYNNIYNMYKIVLALFLLAVSQQQIFSNQSTFCWRDSQVRGAGTPLSTCSSGREKIGLLCYSKCPAGYSRVGFDCHQNCPGGFDDQGLFCRLVEYGRGAGYGWHWNDGFSNNGMISRCENDNGRGNCEMWGAIAYPKCRAGYYAFGCCICRPNPFNCSSFGFKPSSQFDISCAKKIIIGDPKPMICDSSLQQQGGLCYTKCKAGYTGVGPVCWLGPPKGWVECGMGAATTTFACASTTFNQVVSVGMLAINIATFGASGEATALAKGAQLGTDFVSQLKGKFNDIKALYDRNQDIVKFFKDLSTVASTAITAKDVINVLQMSNAQPADIIRVTAEIAALVDPTGVAGVVAAYSYPICSAIKV